MIIVTGAAGFIGSNIVKELNRRGRTDILVVDDLGGDRELTTSTKTTSSKPSRTTTSTARTSTPSSMKVPAPTPWSTTSTT